MSKNRSVAGRASANRAADRGAANRAGLDRKLVTGAWVLFFIAWGVSLWMESTNGVGLRNVQYLMAGLILLGLNLARFLRAIPMSRLTLTLGLAAVAAGAYRLLTGDDSLVPTVAITLLSVLAIEGLARWMGSAAV